MASRSIPQFAHASIREYLAARKAASDEDAARLLARCAKSAAPPKPRAPGRTKEERRVEHRTSTAGLRANVFARSCGRCEACGSELGAVWEMHHIEQGGLRRSRQRSGNVVALCIECHRRVHRGDLGTLAQVARIPSLDAEAARVVENRIDKIERIRSTPSVPVKVVVSGGGRP